MARSVTSRANPICTAVAVRAPALRAGDRGLDDRPRHARGPVARRELAVHEGDVEPAAVVGDLQVLGGRTVGVHSVTVRAALRPRSRRRTRAARRARRARAVVAARSLAALGDEPRAAQHPQVLRDGGAGDVGEAARDGARGQLLVAARVAGSRACAVRRGLPGRPAPPDRRPMLYVAGNLRSSRRLGAARSLGTQDPRGPAEAAGGVGQSFRAEQHHGHADDDRSSATG